MSQETSLYDAQELEILDQIENGEWIDDSLTPKESQSYADSAIYTKSLREKKQTTIRFSVSDLAVVKARAKEMGIGYQNLIQALVHNYVKDEAKFEI